MAGWAGFSDHELQRLKDITAQEEKNRNVKYGMSMKSSSLKKSKAPTVERLLQRGSHTASPPISSSQRLSQPKPTSLPIPNHAGHSGNKIPRERVQIVSSNSVSESNITSSNMETEDSNLEMFMIKEEVDAVEIGAEEALSREMGNLEKFRESQKHMEEANKQRKALLSKTLNERQRKAREEAEKLSHIQKELHKLDNLLSADVTVIRSRIEIASREFLDAQKRYDRAEKEFVEAKMDLQSTSELKEQLTEHLYTIIHQNEVRKSKKLAELMKELEMDASDETVQLPQLPPLASFSSMNAVQTIHTPKSPPATSPDKFKTTQKDFVDTTKDSDIQSSTSQDRQTISQVTNQQIDRNSQLESISNNVHSENEKSVSDATEPANNDSNKSGDLINFSPSKTMANSPKQDIEKLDEESRKETSVSQNQQLTAETTTTQNDLSQNIEKDISQCDRIELPSNESQAADVESQNNTQQSDAAGQKYHTDVNTVSLQNTDAAGQKYHTDVNTVSLQNTDAAGQKYHTDVNTVSLQNTDTACQKYHTDVNTVSLQNTDTAGQKYHTDVNTVSLQNTDAVGQKYCTDVNTVNLQNTEENSQGSNSAEITSESAPDLPSSWTLNLLNIKKEPDT